MSQNFNKRKIFNEQIEPLVNKIDKTCAANQIPFYFTAAVENSAEETIYEHRARTGAPMGITLTNDLLTNHVKVAAGFDVVLPDAIPDIEF